MHHQLAVLCSTVGSAKRARWGTVVSYKHPEREDICNCTFSTLVHATTSKISMRAGNDDSRAIGKMQNKALNEIIINWLLHWIYIFKVRYKPRGINNWALSLYRHFLEVCFELQNNQVINCHFSPGYFIFHCHEIVYRNSCSPEKDS